MTEEDVSHVPSVGPSCRGDVRRGARKRTLTEKGQAYSPKPVTRRRNVDSPVVEGGQGKRVSKATRLQTMARVRAARRKVPQSTEDGGIGMLCHCSSTSSVSCRLLLVESSHHHVFCRCTCTDTRPLPIQPPILLTEPHTTLATPVPRTLRTSFQPASGPFRTAALAMPFVPLHTSEALERSPGVVSMSNPVCSDPCPGESCCGSS
jgi:hypothetical protein